jgi:hypothetical protein
MVQHPAVQRPLTGRADGGDVALPFPPRYRGVFARPCDPEPGDGARIASLSQAARDMLARQLPPDAATRLIGIVERMAAAAAARADDPAGE